MSTHEWTVLVNPQAGNRSASIEDVEGAFADLVRSSPRLDILVNNAAIAGPTAGEADIEPSD